MLNFSNYPCALRLKFRTGFILALFLMTSLFLCGLVNAQNSNPYQQAEEYGRQGKLETMERAYDLLLKKNPADIRARIGRANARSWAGNYKGAQADYQQILATDPKHLGALTGLAYSYAWSRQFDDAEQTFNQAIEIAPDNVSALKGLGFTYLWSGRKKEALNLFNRLVETHPIDTEIQAAMDQARPKKVSEKPEEDAEDLGALVSLGYEHAWAKRFQEAEEIFQRSIRIAPDNLGAQKGLGYVYLWSGRHEEAVDHFKRLARTYPEESEIQVAMGHSNLAMGHPQEAEESFKSALSIDPLRTDAVQGLRAAYDYPALVELNIWGGNTSSGGDTGLRQVEIATWATPRLRLWARFDDSLSLDNPALARSGQDAETYYFGAFHQFSEKWLGTAEFGFRDLPAGADQEIYRLEGVHLVDGHAIKLGGQVSPHSDGYTDELIYAGYGFSVGERMRLEPSIFYSNTGGTNDDEWRGILFGNYKWSNGWSLSAGAGGGYIESAIPEFGGSVKVANAQLTIPVAGYQALHFSVRYENAPSNEFTVVMLGVSLRWPRD